MAQGSMQLQLKALAGYYNRAIIRMWISEVCSQYLECVWKHCLTITRWSWQLSKHLNIDYSTTAHTVASYLSLKESSYIVLNPYDVFAFIQVWNLSMLNHQKILKDLWLESSTFLLHCHLSYQQQFYHSNPNCTAVILLFLHGIIFSCW